MKAQVKLLLLACTAFTLVFTAACGKSGTGSSASGSAAPGGASPSASAGAGASGSAAASGQKVKIAVVAPLSGPFAQNGQNVVKGTELAIAEINESGGIQSLEGAQFELITADAGSADPSHAASVTRRVLQENKDLTAVIGLWSSAFTVAASTVTEQAKVPMLTQSFTDEITSRGYKYVFQFPEKASKMGTSSVDYLLELSKSENFQLDNVAVVADNQSSNKTVGQTTAKQFRDKGVKVSVEEYYQPGLTDATSLSTKIIKATPNLVFVGGAISDVSMIIKTLRGMGYKGTFLGNGAAYVIKEFAAATGDAGNGSFATAGWNWDVPYPGASEFNAKYMNEYGEPFAPQEAGEDYAMVYALKEALEKAASTDHDAVRDALSKLDIPSVMTGGKISFDETGMNKDTTAVLIEWIDGMPRTVYPKEIARMSPVFQMK